MKQFVLNFIKNWAEALVEALIIIIALYIFLWPVKVDGSSMEKTLQTGDWLVICRVLAWSDSYGPGDIVVFKIPGEKDPIVKRIVAVEGDRVTINESGVYINGEKLEEQYVSSETYGNVDTVISEGCFYALGDNRQLSTDSRSFGERPCKSVIGKVLIRILPADKIAALW